MRVMTPSELATRTDADLIGLAGLFNGLMLRAEPMSETWLAAKQNHEHALNERRRRARQYRPCFLGGPV